MPDSGQIASPGRPRRYKAGSRGREAGPPEVKRWSKSGQIAVKMAGRGCSRRGSRGAGRGGPRTRPSAAGPARGAGGQSKWSIRVVDPRGSFEWSIQVVKSSGRSKWSIQAVDSRGKSHSSGRYGIGGLSKWSHPSGQTSGSIRVVKAGGSVRVVKASGTGQRCMLADRSSGQSRRSIPPRPPPIAPTSKSK